MIGKLEKQHVFIIDTGMFRQHILFCYGDNIYNLEKEVLEHCKKEHHRKIKKIFRGLKKDKNYAGIYNSKQPVRIIHVKQQTQLSDFVQVASHEAQHAVIEILDHVGIPLGADSEETYTYLLGHIMESIIYNIFETEEEEEEKEKEPQQTK